MTVADPLQEARRALAEGRVADALAQAEQAWAAVTAEGAADDPAGRRQAGPVLATALYRSGALNRVVDLTGELLPLVRASGPTIELIDMLRMRALCASDINRFGIALESAQQAHRLALGLGDPARLSLALNALGCFFERSGDPWQAERLMREALALARPLDDPYARFAALNNIGAVLIGMYYLLRDSQPTEEAHTPLREALPFVQEALTMARAGGEVFPLVFIGGNLAEALVGLGRGDEAEALLAEAEVLAAQHGFEAQRWRLGCTRGELVLLRGDADAAAQKLEAVLAECAHTDPRATHLRLHHALWRAHAAADRPAAALHHLEAYQRLERARMLTQLRAQSELFVTRMEAEQVRQEAERQRDRATSLEADVRRDELTGLGNRRELERRWPALRGQASDKGAPLTVAMLDLDRFKQINDEHGHAVGDQVLVALAGLLRGHTRSADLVVRLGGEEFLLVLPDTNPVRAAEICERLRQQVEAHDWAALAPGLAVTTSIGVASAPPHDPDRLTLEADAALYAAKAAGRNRVQVA